MADPAPDSDEIRDILRTIELYEDDEVCDSATIVVETGLDRATVDYVLEYLWREDQIECRTMKNGDQTMLTGIRWVLPERSRRWGERGRYESR